MNFYKRNEVIELLTPEGTWLKGRYIGLTDDEKYPHIIECFELSYFPGIKVPDNKIRKVIQ